MEHETDLLRIKERKEPAGGGSGRLGKKED